MPDDRQRTMGVLRRLVISLATLLVVGVVVLDVLSSVGWPDGGPIALAGVFAAHLTIVALVIGIAVALLGGTGWLRISFVVLVVLTLVRFSGEWLSIPDGTPAATPRLQVATFNLEWDGRPTDETIQILRDLPADVVAVQELTPDVSAAIAADLGLAKQFPYQSLYPRHGAMGLGLLSRYPLANAIFDVDPPSLAADTDGPLGRIRIVNLHPLHDTIDQGAFGIPLDYPVERRDAALDSLRTTFIGDGAAPPTILLGDINTAPTEPAFGRFTAGLRDAHAEVGTGPGWTYRPDRLEWLGIGLVRIDVVLTGDGLRPITESTSCPTQGDHCAVLASIVADPGD
jgi:vancomycin resistance protein VanJ